MKSGLDACLFFPTKKNDNNPSYGKGCRSLDTAALLLNVYLNPGYKNRYLTLSRALSETQNKGKGLIPPKRIDEIPFFIDGDRKAISQFPTIYRIFALAKAKTGGISVKQDKFAPALGLHDLHFTHRRTVRT